jgi:predicted nuclease of restriction endonuclease-like RecB superfamily
MLTGKLVRVRHARNNKLVPQYLDSRDSEWLAVAEQLLFVFRDSPGRTRGELADDLANFIGEGPGMLVHQGLAKLLEDRCETEVASDLPPDEIREKVFHAAATFRQLAVKTRVPFDRCVILKQVGDELNLETEKLDQALFADLRDEQRILKFDALTPEQLLNRYNVALAQAVILRSTGMEVRVWGESPSRFRQLFRAVRFHRLICTIRETPGNSYTLNLDGPLSLFSATQKYGLQLALFLPTLLHCKAFDLHAEVRWGSERKSKQFALSATDGLRPYTPDFGTYKPKEFDIFVQNFRATVTDWELSAEPNPVPLDDGLWVPDFKLTHTATGREVFIELFGFWRKADIESHHRRLKRQLPGQFVLVVSEQLRTDEDEDATFCDEVYRYKRTPSAEAVAKAAAKVIGVR